MNLMSASTCANVCGVFLSIFGKGILLKGKSGTGKSDLALSLVERGHQLIADDMVEFRLTDTHTLLGSAPALLQNHLHIRDLGVLNVTCLFGLDAVMAEQTLSLVIELQKDISPSSDISPHQDTFSLFDITVPQFHLSVFSTRPLVLLLETLVRNHYLVSQEKVSTSQIFLEKYYQLLRAST